MKLSNILQVLGVLMLTHMVHADDATTTAAPAPNTSSKALPKLNTEATTSSSPSVTTSSPTGVSSKSSQPSTQSSKTNSNTSKDSAPSSRVPSLTATSSSSPKPALPSFTTSSSTSSLPASTSTSSSSTLEITFTPVVPTDVNRNPNISFETLPSGLVFIAVGAAFGLVLVSLIITQFFCYCMSRKRAKDAKIVSANNEYYETDSNFSGKKENYAHSIYSLGSASTLNVLGSQNSPDLKQGRSYRYAITRASRSSLFLSPTEMLSMPTIGNNARDSYFDMDNSPIDSPREAYFDQNSSSQKEKKARRPPSVYMEKLLDDDLSVNSDPASDEYDFTSEKV